ncbi:hypothetical protein CYY_000759 [Polysphondylium violaceum]|uniref:Uncharacterized protein n=1 Tax=Polysphondylium violaceum TaxID=133409 RepID=A0A8J4Q335_9MYCE|nr:hypothetical protein CYY_000759 [Polysphondylium violaceum]
MTIDNSFYSIWRNRFLSIQIRKQVLENLDIKVDLQDLNANKQYLATLRNEKISLKLHIKSKEHFIEYLDHSEGYLVSNLEIDPKVEICRLPKLRQKQQPKLIGFDCRLIPNTVTKLKFWIEEAIMGYGKLPDSITELEIRSSWRTYSSKFFDHVLANLPQQLVSLTLTSNCDIRNQVVLPNSLCELKYSSTYDNLRKLVVPPSVKRGMVPPKLSSLFVDKFNEKLERDVLPDTLKYLRIRSFNQQLEPGVLPINLKTLTLDSFNKKLEPDILPPSLKALYLNSYTRPLDPYVLPQSLTKLGLNNFNHPLQASSLPASLTNLTMDSFCQSLESVGSLPNLHNVFIAQIDQYISNLLVNVKDVSLKFQKMTTTSTQPVSLSNTSIEKLVINSVSQTITIDCGFLPRTLTDLSMTGLAIASSSVIPEGCLFLKTDIVDLKPEFLPKSIITNKLIK